MQRNPGSPRLQGGFIWDLVDQGLLLPPLTQSYDDKPRFGYGGDFGDVPHTANFCCNGLLSADRRPHPSALEAAALQCPVGVTLRQFQAAGTEGKSGSERPALSLDNICLAVENRFSHVSLESVDILVALRCNASPACSVVPSMPLPSDPLVALSLPPYPVCRIRGRDLAILPGGIEGLPLLSLVPSLADALKKGPSAEERLEERMKALSDALSLSSPLDLRLASECWIEVTVVNSVATPALPESHVLLRTSLTHPTMSAALTGAAKEWTDHVGGTNDWLAIPSWAIVVEQPAPRSKEFHDKSRGGEEEPECIKIRWANGSVAKIGVQCGRLVSWTTGPDSDTPARQLLAEPLDACLWRAPTDNDRGGAFFSYQSQWAAYGLGSLVRRPCGGPDGGDPLCSIVSCCEQLDGSVIIEAEWRLESSVGSTLPCSVPVEATYVFLTNGGVAASFSVRPPSFLPPLPRVGLSLALPDEFQHVQWMGLGPHEAYSDRRSCVYLGAFEGSVAGGMHTDYIYPQENGHRLAPRWVILSAAPAPHAQQQAEGAALLIIPAAASSSSSSRIQRLNDGWGFSASRFSTAQLQRTSHSHSLLDEGKTWVHVDSAHMGVGGYDSWSPNVEGKHLIEASAVGSFTTDVFLLPCRRLGRTSQGTLSSAAGKLASEAYAQFLLGGFGDVSSLSAST